MHNENAYKLWKIKEGVPHFYGSIKKNTPRRLRCRKKNISTYCIIYMSKRVPTLT